MMCQQLNTLFVMSMSIFIVTSQSINTLKEKTKRYRSTSLNVARIAKLFSAYITLKICHRSKNILFNLLFFLYKSRKLKSKTYRDNVETFNKCRYYRR